MAHWRSITANASRLARPHLLREPGGLTDTKSQISPQQAIRVLVRRVRTFEASNASASLIHITPLICYTDDAFPLIQRTMFTAAWSLIMDDPLLLVQETVSGPCASSLHVSRLQDGSHREGAEGTRLFRKDRQKRVVRHANVLAEQLFLQARIQIEEVEAGVDEGRGGSLSNFSVDAHPF